MPAQMLLGQFQERNSPEPHSLEVHAVRGTGKPMCGRWYESWNGKVMDFIKWHGDGSEVTCRHHACQRMAA